MSVSAGDKCLNGNIPQCISVFDTKHSNIRKKLPLKGQNEEMDGKGLHDLEKCGFVSLMLLSGISLTWT